MIVLLYKMRFHLHIAFITLVYTMNVAVSAQTMFSPSLMGAIFPASQSLPGMWALLLGLWLQVGIYP